MIVAFTGKKRHGKSTAAQALVRRGFTLINFADPVRKVAHDVYGLSYEEMERDDLKEAPIDRWPFLSPRDILKLVGTDMFRTHLPQTWTEWFRRAVRECGNRNVVCGDLRFLNEAALIANLDGCTARVFNPRRPAPTDTHASEAEMDLIRPTFTFINDRDIASLERAVQAQFCES